MDPDKPQRPKRRGKFTPKPPPTRPTPNTIPDNTVTEDDEAAQQNLRRILDKHLNKGKPKEENRNTAQVTFTLGVESNTIRTFGKGKGKIEGTSDQDNSKESVEGMQVLSTYASTAGTGVGENSPGLTDDAPTVKTKKKGEYKEPWDGHSNYPVDLPWRMPNTGNPELLDAAEFRGAPVYDENSVSSASQLGLLDQEDDSPKLMFLQLPANLPGSSRASRVSKGKEIAGSSTNQKHGSLEEWPAGKIGKLLVYKSGAVKWKLGDILYDVSPGVECMFSQNLMAINTTDEHCYNLGELNTRAVITPDTDYLLDNVDRNIDLWKP